MAVYGMAAAQLLFDSEDCLWHLYSGGDFLTSKRLHPLADDEVHLVAIPLALWSSISPILLNISRVDDPFDAYQLQRAELVRREMAKAQEFIRRKLTPNEREVVRLLAMEALSDEEIAGRLVKSPRTVERQLRSAYCKAKDFFGLEEVNRTHLISLLKVYFVFQTEEP